MTCVFQIKLISDKNSAKPRGYAFIEYEHERDMHCKYPTTNCGQGYSQPARVTLHWLNL